jgi:hypothetical protein
VSDNRPTNCRFRLQRHPMTQSSTDSSLVERLRDYAGDDHERLCQGRNYDCTCGYDARRDPLIAAAADELTALTAKVALLSEALKPFSEAAGGVFTRNANASDVLFRKPATASHAESVITAGHLFAARSALQSEEDRDGGE